MMTEKEKMLSGGLYWAGDPELVQERERCKELLKQHNIRALIPNAHESLYIQSPFYCDYGYNISCGENVFINANCVFLDVAKISIGSYVLFGPAVQIYTASHPLDYMIRRTLEFGRPISIGDDSWIGGGAIIMPGVSIGRRCVIGAGAVVTKDVPDDSLAVGNPAKVIRKLN
ncbi:sugar O-acetyltransferase [Peredibacter sp. HCB2-198]|uniref:sugar O-acetyltransferase n=1 Tax=Peredibacter sp. HCB2-198 TaxID=3383025 RepID=UPI0038B6973E